MVDDSRTRLAAELAALRVRVHELEAKKKQHGTQSPAEKMLESASDGLLWADRDGRVSLFNPAASELLGWPIDDAIGADCRRVLALAKPNTPHPFETVLSTGATEHHEKVTFKRKDGKRTVLSVSAAPVKLRGEVAGIVASLKSADPQRLAANAEFSQAQFDALIDVAASGEADAASFPEAADSFLDSLLLASGADRIVLLVTERPDGHAGQLMAEAPSGSNPPAKSKRTKRGQVPTDGAETSPLAKMPSINDAGVKSIVALPLKVDDRVVGMLSAVSSKPDYFDRNRVRLLTAAVDRLVMAHQRRKWRQDADGLTIASETLFSASRIMSSHGGFDEKASALLRLAVRTAGGNAATFFGAERQGGSLRCLAGGPFEADLHPAAVARSVVGRAQVHKAATTLYDTANDDIVRGLDREAKFAVAIPVLVASEVHGVMLVVGRADVSLSPDKLRLLSAIAEHLGVLLMNARLGQRVNASLDREFAVLEAVKTAAERLAIVGTPANALGHLVETARDVVGARIGGVAVWRRSGALETLVSADLENGLSDRQPGAGIVPEVLRLVRYALVQERRRSILVNDSPFTEGGEEIGAGFNSVLGVPFTCTDGRTGAIFMVDKEPSGRFTAEDERLLGLFCAMASVLLDNIRLFRAEERERRTLDSIHSSMAEGLIVLDEDGQVMSCNAAAETLLEMGQSEIRGRSLRAWVLRNVERFEEAERSRNFAKMLEAFQPGATELSMVGHSRRDVMFSIFPIDVADGERLTGVLLRDVTEEREHERRRDTFVSIASHELRGPMTTVMGFTELMMSGDYPPERRAAWLKHIYDDATRVVEIVDDLLNVSRIQAGKLEFATEPVSAAKVLESTAEKFRAASENHQIVVNLRDELPPVIADRNKFTQIVVNLVSNAIKYSPKGGTVTLAAAHEPDRGHVVVSVSDEGIGIAEKDKARLFHTFQRIQRPETEGIKGTGLGLYIVKGLVENMGGEIWLESAENEGSTFFVAMPTWDAVSEAPAA